MSNAYAEMGFGSRKSYLTNLADEFGVDVETVMALTVTIWELMGQLSFSKLLLKDCQRLVDS